MRLSRFFFYPARMGAAPKTQMRAGSVLVVAELVVAGFCGWIGPAAAQNPPDGSQIYMESGCFVCHGQMGDGGAGPRLRGDPFLSITDYVAAQILLGRGIMPAFGQSLNDQQIAAVASYIRTDWGNKYGEVKPQEVAQIRKKFDAMNQAATGPPPPSSGTGNAR
jgi:mono/diheme cytochrome c family protein